MGWGSGRSSSMALRSGARLVADPSERRQDGARAEGGDPLPAAAHEARGEVPAEVVARLRALEAHVGHPEVAGFLEAVERLAGGVLDRRDPGMEAQGPGPRSEK